MIDTNLVLAFSFSAISNLARLGEFPPQEFPRTTADLRKVDVMPIYKVFQAFLHDTNGSNFWVRDGIVRQFRSYDCFMQRQDDREIDRFRGQPTLTTNQVLEKATSFISRLGKDWNPIANVAPRMSQEMGRNDEAVPFYWVSWPSTNKLVLTRYSAFVEIDARKGWVTYFDLLDDGFYDRELASQIKKRAYTPDPRPARAPMPALSASGTNQIVRAIPGWLRFCNLLEVAPGNYRELTDIDWDKTFIYTNALLSKSEPVCVVHFRDAAAFEAVGTITFTAVSPEACFAGRWQEEPRERFDRFMGRVNEDWKDLAGRLEKKLIERAGIPKALFERYRPDGRRRPPQLGDQTMVRLMVDWRWWPKRDDFVSIEESRLGMSAEFDLQTGKLMLISLGEEDPKFLQALRRPAPDQP